ncbi:MAG: tyrosine-type recombinase/integrase [Candidatus Bathyarchaeota archaeon]|nr:tyrosine-type recombinase/integrase [Candidatus Bathyarchaeota archaeon]
MLISRDHVWAFENAISLKSDATRETYTIFVEGFIRKSVGDLSRDSIIQFLKTIPKNSVTTAFYALKFFYKAAGLPFDVSRGDVVPRGIKRLKPALTLEEAKKMIETVPKYFGTVEVGYLALSSIYGLRRSEIYRVTKDDIDIERRIFTATVKKGIEIEMKRPHLIPEEIVPVMYEMKEGLSMIKSIPYITRLNFMFDLMAARSGVEMRKRIGFHSFRRLLASQLLLAGLQEIVINKFMRWIPRGISMIEHYFAEMENPEIAIQIDKKVFEVHPILKLWSGESVSRVDEDVL